MIVLNIWGYLGRNKQNSYAALRYTNNKSDWKWILVGLIIWIMVLLYDEYKDIVYYRYQGDIDGRK